MTSDQRKRAAAQAALDQVRPKLERHSVLGIGTGSTANHFIDLLATVRGEFESTVSSSAASTRRLRGHGISVDELNSVDGIQFYVDGADECNPRVDFLYVGGVGI